MTPKLELIHLPAQGTARHAPPLLFVHGAFCGAWCWQPHFLPWFARQGYECWALSLEGHGNSEGRRYLPAIGIDDYRKNLAWAIRQLDTPPVVIAHSMGGYVVQQYLRHATLPGVVLLASVPPTGLAASSLRLLAGAPSLFIKLNLYQHGQYNPDFDELRALLFSADTPDDDIEWLIRHSQPESQRAVLDMTLVNPLTIGRIHRPPALVLGAAGDALIHDDDVKTTARHLGVQAETLPAMGHMTMLDTHWQQCAERIADWLPQAAYSGETPYASMQDV
ncbi:alpha/beta hydrolase [Paludibacterium purpuratum]|uniref:Pimeloyl-ACP methyl ester carboxylesterase n=1 Tax=Paludibacterium purpuratum TaxID=1144873 RepID=A0A4R7BCW5_9NEIS|nr:alpha/beta hydrolase [Paludibacterium purpuratum]TDR82002.1 pimeloyl-ACP methyl ester carboxylesterase [Paludibacterium purpuratum]